MIWYQQNRNTPYFLKGILVMYEEIRESMDSDNAAETVSAEPEVEISTLPENHESNGNTEDAPESCYLP